MLGHALQTKQAVVPTPPAGKINTEPTVLQKDQPPFILPIDVRAFLSQYGLNETILWKFFLKEGKDIRPVYQLKTVKKAAAQIHLALMLALENAIINGQFQVNIEALRNRCTELKCYDTANFTKNIKDNANLFKTISNDEPLVLSPDGKSELAELIEQLQG